MLRKHDLNIAIRTAYILIGILLFAPVASPATITTPCYHAAVSTSEKQATEVGLAMLKKGGNAIDAAVAIGYALAVVEPCCGNIGGGGFMLIRLNGQPAREYFINFREKAPAKLTTQHFFNRKGQFQKAKTEQGYLAAGVPGTVLGLNHALERYGSLPLKTVLAPAIQLAKEGFILNETDARHLAHHQKSLWQKANTRKIFFKKGKIVQAGDIIKQPQLAQTLTDISQHGSKAFYHGNIAKQIALANKKQGGAITLDDLRRYTLTEEPPLHCSYRGYDIVTAPPPSSGGTTLCEMLKIIEKYDIACDQCPPESRIHLMLEAMRYAYADRNQLGDPAFVNNPITELLSKKHIDSIEKSIQLTQSTPSDLICPSPPTASKEKANTTHYSIVDSAGNAVAVTYSLNQYFGAQVIPDKTGFFLNNHINDFTLPLAQSNLYQLVQGQANAIAGNKRPLSSMTPTLVLKDGQLKMVLGTPGGPTIMSTLFQVLVWTIDLQNTLQTAVDYPRFHMQCQPDTVFMEQGVFTAQTEKKLAAMGYHLQLNSVYQTARWGAIAGIAVETRGQQMCLNPVIDNRRPDGLAIGIE